VPAPAVDTWLSFRVETLPLDQLVDLNERGLRCRQAGNCGRHIEFAVSSRRRGSRGRPDHHWRSYACFQHACAFALDHNLDLPARPR